MEVNLYDVKKKTKNIGESIEYLRDIARSMDLLGMDRGAVEIRILANDIAGDLESIDDLVNEYGRIEYIRAVEASGNILATALAVGELAKETKDEVTSK
jgi:hypothetical protein